jgi:16S rRNA processing protein RimM
MTAETKNTAKNKLMTLGKVTSLYGVRGWVKIYSHTEPMENILSYSPWQLKLDGRWQTVEVDQGKRHGKGLVARLAGCESREEAQRYCGAEIAVERSLLPGLAPGEFYWHQLEKLNVVTESGDKLGRVDHLISTGSNDVLVVKGNADSIDERERLIPYLPEQVVKDVSLETGTIRVDWDPEF